MYTTSRSRSTPNRTLVRPVAFARSSMIRRAFSWMLAGARVAWLPITFNWTPARYCPSSVRSSIPQAASSVASRWAVEMGRPVRRATSVREYTLPVVKVNRMAMTLLVTERPASAELPAMISFSLTFGRDDLHTARDRRARFDCHPAEAHRLPHTGGDIAVLCG